MSPDRTSTAALFEALAATPARLDVLALEVQRQGETLQRIEAALPSPLLTIAEAAGALRVSIPTMRRWVRKGCIPVVKIENTVRVDLSRIHLADDVEVARLARAAREKPSTVPLAISGSHK